MSEGPPRKELISLIQYKPFGTVNMKGLELEIGLTLDAKRIIAVLDGKAELTIFLIKERVNSRTGEKDYAFVPYQHNAEVAESCEADPKYKRIAESIKKTLEAGADLTNGMKTIEKESSPDESLESEEEKDWDFSNVKWLESIHIGKERHIAELPKSTKIINDMVFGDIFSSEVYGEWIGHKITGFVIEGYDEPTDTWIVGLKVADGLDAKEIDRINNVFKERIGQTIRGTGAFAVYFLLDKSYKVIH